MGKVGVNWEMQGLFLDEVVHYSGFQKVEPIMYSES